MATKSQGPRTAARGLGLRGLGLKGVSGLWGSSPALWVGPKGPDNNTAKWDLGLKGFIEFTDLSRLEV